MSISTTLKRLSKERTKTPNLILEIEGFSKFFSSLPVEKSWRLDDIYFFDTPGLRWDTPFPDPRYIPAIDDSSSSKTLSQQILPDKEGTTSIPIVKIALLNLDNLVLDNFTFGQSLNDILGKKASLYFTYKGASHPEDSLPILFGYVDDYTIEHGRILLSISHPENLKRKEIFNQYIQKLTANITNSQTSIPVITADNFFTSQDAVTSYIQINDEIMRVNSKTATTFSVTRAQFGTIAVAHELNDEVSSIYQLQGQPIELALKLYMSGVLGFYGSVPITSFRDVSSANIANAIFFEGIDIKEQEGLVVGDQVQVTGSTSNNGTFTITGFGANDFGTYLIVNSPRVLELNTNGVLGIRSKYNVLPFGLRLTGREVDVQGHDDIDRLNPNQFPDYTFYLKQDENGKEFIDRQIYFPVALYSIPRKAKISLKLVQPPLTAGSLVRINESNIENVENIRVRRSTHKYLYNTLFYRFNQDPLDDDFTSAALYRNEFSAARIPIGTKQMRVESRGLRESTATRNLLFRQQQRIFDRYKFAAQEILNVSVLNEVGFSIEVGDIIAFGSEGLQLVDLSTGRPVFQPRLVEVVNKEFNLFTGRINLTLLESAFDLNARYGVISPSSIIDSGSSINQIKLKLSFSVGEFEFETDKWEQFIGEKIWIRSPDYSVSFNTIVRGINPSNRSFLIVDNMPSIPLDNYIIEIPEYQVADPIYKDVFVYFNPSVTITSVINAQEFNVTTPSRFYVGSPIYIVSDNFSYDTFEQVDVLVDAIAGSKITLNKPLLAAPPVNARVELIGFSFDNGAPYRII